MILPTSTCDFVLPIPCYQTKTCRYEPWPAWNVMTTRIPWGEGGGETWGKTGLRHGKTNNDEKTCALHLMVGTPKNIKEYMAHYCSFYKNIFVLMFADLSPRYFLGVVVDSCRFFFWPGWVHTRRFFHREAVVGTEAPGPGKMGVLFKSIDLV